MLVEELGDMCSVLSTHKLLYMLENLVDPGAPEARGQMGAAGALAKLLASRVL